MRRAIILVLTVLLALPVLAACKQTGGTAATSASPAATSASAAAPKGAKHTNILLMGSGHSEFEKPSENYYALTHMLITLDPDNRVVKVTTFPYNLAVTAYSKGKKAGKMQLQMVGTNLGTDAVIETLETNFGVSIDHWVVMNMSGLIDIVDAVNGVEIDVDRKSINELAKQPETLFGHAWETVKSLGKQVLSGIQTLGFFCDTYPDEDSKDRVTDEETLFRDRHPKIVNALVAAVKAGKMTPEELCELAESVQDDYATDIPEEEWPLLAETALYCMENPVKYLHIPETIQKTTVDGRESIAYGESDAKAAAAFAGE